MVNNNKTLNRIKSDIEILINEYNKDNNCYSENEIIYIRLGLTKALKIIEKYIKLKGE